MKHPRKITPTTPGVHSRQHISRPAWEEESGFLSFLTGVRTEIVRFADKMGFDITTDLALPQAIDGDPAMPRALGFVAVRRNALLAGKTYCLYSLIRGRTLHGYIGIHTGDNIKTLKELKPLSKFQRGPSILYDWLRHLIKASSDKI